MDFSIVILTILFLVLIGLFAFCLTEPRGKNTVYARKDKAGNKATMDTGTGLKQDPISQSNDVAYNIQKNRTEAA
jgi:hypothetical protein